MDFVRNKFGTNEPLPVEHFFPYFLAAQQTGQKLRKKSVQRAEVHLYRIKIHILVSARK